jgi:hypothetical protein
MPGFISLRGTVGVVGSQTILIAGLLHEVSKVLSDSPGPVSSTGEKRAHWKTDSSIRYRVETYSGDPEGADDLGVSSPVLLDCIRWTNRGAGP